MAKRRWGGDLLKQFLERHNILPADAAKMLHVSPASLHYWLTAGKAPKAGKRLRIEKWSRGEVPADSWASPDEIADASDFDPLPKAAGA